MAAWLSKILDAEEAMADDGLATRYGCTPTSWYIGEKIPGTEQYLIMAGRILADKRPDHNAIGIAGSHHLAALLVHRDPKSALARVAADRLILEDYDEAVRRYADNRTPLCEGWRHAALMAVARVASAYADRPGYREEWRP
jgi:uncharacterized protein DUF6221